MGALLGLIPIIGQLFGFGSTIANAINSPLAGSILQKAMDIAERIFGTRDPSQIAAQIELDKVKADQFKATLDAATKEEQAYYADLQSARQQTVQLAQAGSVISWGAPIMSILVTLGFMVVLTIFISYALVLDTFQQAVLNVLVGYLGAAFQQAVSYWLGSTRQSKDKDATLTALAMTTAQTAQTTAQTAQSAAAKSDGNGKMFR